MWNIEPSRVLVVHGGIPTLTPTILTAHDVHDFVERMLRSNGRRVDLSSPTRPHAPRRLAAPRRYPLHQPAPWGNIGKFVVEADYLDDLVRLGTVALTGRDVA